MTCDVIYPEGSKQKICFRVFFGQKSLVLPLFSSLTMKKLFYRHSEKNASRLDCPPTQYVDVTCNCFLQA